MKLIVNYKYMLIRHVLFLNKENGRNLQKIYNKSNIEFKKKEIFKLLKIIEEVINGIVDLYFKKMYSFFLH